MTVFAGVAAVLDGVGGAVVEAGEAEVAVACAPYGTAILNGDELVGAEVGTEAAAGAGIARSEAARGGGTIEGVHGDGGETTHAVVWVEVASGAGFELGDNAVDIAFGTLKDGIGLGTVATLEHGRVGVGHQHREVGIDFATQGFLEHVGGSTRGAAGGEDGVGVVAALDSQLSRETVDGGGDAPKIDGEDETDRAAVVGDGSGDVLGDKGDGVAEGLGDALGNIAAVASTSEIIYHIDLLESIVLSWEMSLSASVREMGRRAALSCWGSGARVMTQAARSMTNCTTTSQTLLRRRRMAK